MVTPPRFRLKAEVIARPDGPQAQSYPFARIWVDTGVFHLDTPYDYAVPEILSDYVVTGVRVQVPFNGREVEGIVLERSEALQTSGRIKVISKVLSPHPVATVQSLKLIERVAKHWAANPWDILRSAIPPRVANIDRTYSPVQEKTQEVVKDSGIFTYIAFDPYKDPAKGVALLITRSLRTGSVLVIAPDERDIDAICKYISESKSEYIRLDSSLPRADRYRNYLTAMDARNTIVIGARGAIFTQVRDLRTVIIYKESSHEHFEVRTPGWNVRDVAILRKKTENVSVIFTGYVPSLELSTLIDSKHLTYITHSQRMPVKAFSSNDGALLPGRIFSEIRKGLALGPVLFLMPRKGYGNALLCARCRNLAMCKCGARLIVPSKGASPLCVLCATTYPNWKCAWCQHDKQYVAGRGIERAAEEISRAFPGVPTLLSFGGVIKTHVDNKPALVLATPGAIPLVNGGYGAVVILEGLKFFSHPDLRSQERARELFFESAAMINPEGALLLSIDESHPIVATIARWNPGTMIRRELAERMEIPLPPFVTSVVISGPTKDFTSIASGLRKAIDDLRLPGSVKVYGPTNLGKGLAKIVLYCPHIDSQALTIFLHELQRRRSIAKKEHLSIRIDPYSL